MVFFLSCAACSWNFYKAIATEPGFVPNKLSDMDVKMVSHVVVDHYWTSLMTEAIEELADAGRLNGTNFCIMCMVSPLLPIAAVRNASDAHV